MSKDLNLQANFSTELQFLVNCCKSDPSENDIKEILTYLDTKDLDINTLVKLANQHGVLPLVYKTIKNLSDLELNSDTPVIKMKEGCNDHLNAQRSTLNAEILTELKAHYMSISHRNMLMSAELIRIMKLFEEHDIEALAFKGPALAQMAYEDITLRQYSDLDILIPTKDLFHAASLLIENNYTIHGSIDFLNDPVWIEGAKDMTLFHDRKNIVLEMHWKLFHSTFANYTNKVNIWNKTEKIKINHVNIPTLNTNILLTYLCIHGSRHLWERLEWIADIDRVIRHMEIEWDEVLELANMFQSKNMLFLGLSLSQVIFGTILPIKIQTKIQTKKVTYLTYSIMKLIPTPISKKSTTTNIILRKSIHASMQDSFKNKIIYWKNVFFQKNYTTILEENTPNKHTSLLSLTRPYALIKKFFFRRNHNL